MTKVLMILPAFNEEENILNTARQIESYTPPEGVQVDYIVINDGSQDNTAAVCKQNGIPCLTLVQNLGIGGAVQTGYIYAARKGYDIAVQFDGDGQHDINSLGALVMPIIEGKSDFVVGSRFLQEGASGFKSTFMRRVGIRYLSLMIRLVSRIKPTDATSGYRAAGKEAIKFLSLHYPTDYPEPESLVTLYKSGFHITEAPVNMFERAHGRSSINFTKSIYYMIKVSFAILCAGMQRKVARPNAH